MQTPGEGHPSRSVFSPGALTTPTSAGALGTHLGHLGRLLDLVTAHESDYRQQVRLQRMCCVAPGACVERILTSGRALHRSCVWRTSRNAWRTASLLCIRGSLGAALHCCPGSEHSLRGLRALGLTLAHSPALPAAVPLRCGTTSRLCALRWTSSTHS